MDSSFPAIPFELPVVCPISGASALTVALSAAPSGVGSRLDLYPASAVRTVEANPGEDRPFGGMYCEVAAILAGVRIGATGALGVCPPPIFTGWLWT